MSTESSIVSFTDGDLVLHSSDGVEFRVDFVVLRRCSTFFNDLSVLPSAADAPTPSSQHAPRELRMNETSITLNAIIRAVYSLAALPELKTREEGIDFMIAVEKLQMSNHTIGHIIDMFLSDLDALRAWALAVRFNRDEARMKACRSIIMSGPGIFSSTEEIEDLDSISARALARLQRTVAEATTSAQAIAGQTNWMCGAHHELSTYTKKYLDDWHKDPWNGERYTSTILAGMHRAEVCGDCTRGFVSYQESALPDVSKILDEAARKEAGIAKQE
ncbi:hypothetical protein DL93DRAFT_289899 [Clavulina sp. PMI_390]|nr:hypothetical protein DL93DRAFT_289899 [Clavulina sp. PMI_390]